MNGNLPPTDLATVMLYDANKKSVGVAYLLWFFLGGLGVHRFYAGRTTSGVAILLITLGSILLMIVGIGLITIWVAVLWVLIDALLIPGMIQKYNTDLATQYGLPTGGAVTVAST